MGGHIAENLKTRGPKLTQSRRKLTVNNVGDRILLPEILVSFKKRSSPLSLSQIWLFAIRLIGSKLLCQSNAALYPTFVLQL